MTEILIALALGIVAGVIDAAPMIRPEIPRVSVLYVFSQWVFIGLLIPFVEWDLTPWIKGILIAELGMVPVMVLTFYRNRKKVPFIMMMAAVLGAGIGIAGSVFIG
jgi:hypothetical protein